MTSSHGGKKMWCVGELDDEYIFKMEDVLKIYERPLSEREPVVCVDEKPVVLHKDTRPSVPMQPGQVARRDYEYERCGTANVFCGIEPKAGVHFTKVTPAWQHFGEGLGEHTSDVVAPRVYRRGPPVPQMHFH